MPPPANARHDVERLLAIDSTMLIDFPLASSDIPWPWQHMVPLMQSAWVWVALMIVFLSLPSSLLCTRASTLICNYLYSLAYTKNTRLGAPRHTFHDDARLMFYFCLKTFLVFFFWFHSAFPSRWKKNLRLDSRVLVWWWAARDGFSSFYRLILSTFLVHIHSLFVTWAAGAA